MQLGEFMSKGASSTTQGATLPSAAGEVCLWISLEKGNPVNMGSWGPCGLCGERHARDHMEQYLPPTGAEHSWGAQGSS